MEKTAYMLCRIQHQICDYVQCSPGLHSRDLSRKLNIPFSTLRYHLVFLEKQKVLRCDRVGKYARYYVSDTIGIDESCILSMVQNTTQKQILVLLLVNTAVSKEELSACLRKHPTTIMFHLKKLLERDIVIIQSGSDDLVESKEKMHCPCQTNAGTNNRRYRLKNPDLVAMLMHKYSSDTSSVHK